jgi:hypothetical protein
VSDANANVSATTAERDALSDHFKLHGRTLIEHFSYFRSMEGKTNGRDSGEILLSGSARGEFVAANASFRARYDLADSGRSTIDPYETYVELHLSPVTIRAGRLNAAWGRTNLANPTDIINPIDLRDPFAPEKLPTYMVRTDVVLGRVTIEGYLLPVPEMHLLPNFDVDSSGRLVSSSRWLDPSVLQQPGSDMRYELVAGSAPPISAANLQYAVRMTLAIGGFDLSAGYAYMFDRIPVLRTQEMTDSSGPMMGLSMEYPRVHLFTFDAERAFGKLRLATESLAKVTYWSDPGDPAIEEPTLTSVVGADYRTPEFFDGHYMQFFLDYQFTRGLTGPLARDATETLRRPFLDQFLSRILYQAGPDLGVSVDVLLAPDGWNYAIRPNVRYTMFDHLTVGVGALFLGGAGPGYYQSNAYNSRLQALMQLNF